MHRFIPTVLLLNLAARLLIRNSQNKGNLINTFGDAPNAAHAVPNHAVG